MILKIIKLTFILILIPSILFANTKYFEDGVNFYKNKKFKKAKFKFEQDIVLNPKNENSYLYLSKIFANLDKTNQQEQNLNTVILINPKNEEAIYNLAKLKLKSSDYEKSKQLNDRLSLLCDKFCGQSQKLENEIKKLSKK